jgi:hypothetical protein
MPAFLVELPVSGGKTLIGGADSYVVFALDAADARAMAANHFDGDSNALWLSAQTTVTEIVANPSLPDNFELEVLITNNGAGAGIAVPAVYRATGGPGNVALAGGVVGAAPGATYADNEIVTCVGGTFTRAATFRVTGQTTGAVDTVELEDPGEYTVLPTLDEIVTTTGGTGDGNLTIDGVAALENSYEVLLGQMVTLLNGDPEIAGAACQMSEGLAGPRLFTIAAIGDDIGDSTVQVRLGAPNSGAIPSLIGAITHEGIAAAVLSFALPALGATTTVMPQVLRALKSGS